MKIIEELQWHCDALPPVGERCPVYTAPGAAQWGIAQQLLAQLTPTARAPQHDKVECDAALAVLLVPMQDQYSIAGNSHHGSIEADSPVSDPTSEQV